MNDQYMQLLQDRITQTFNKYDAALLSLCSAALALSVASISFGEAYNGLTWLYTSWVVWAISISLQLAGHLISGAAMSYELENDKKPSYRNIPAACNITALVTFLVAIICYLFFASANIVPMSNTTQTIQNGNEKAFPDPVTPPDEGDETSVSQIGGVDEFMKPSCFATVDTTS